MNNHVFVTKRFLGSERSSLLELRKLAFCEKSQGQIQPYKNLSQIVARYGYMVLLVSFARGTPPREPPIPYDDPRPRDPRFF